MKEERKYIHIRAFKRINIGFVILLIFFVACNRNALPGLYISREPGDYCIRLDNEGTFRYQYNYNLCFEVTSGEWRHDGTKIVLNSFVKDVAHIPLSVSPLNEGNSNQPFVILKNFNLTYYDWFCIINTDTIELNTDTLDLTSYVYPCQLRIMAKPLDYQTLSLLPIGENQSYYSAPLYSVVESETIIIKERKKHEIKIDSVFGENPFNYLVIHDGVFRITKHGIIDNMKGFYLPYIP